MLLSCKNFMLPDFTRKKIFAQENDGGGGGGGTAATCPPFSMACYLFEPIESLPFTS